VRKSLSTAFGKPTGRMFLVEAQAQKNNPISSKLFFNGPDFLFDSECDSVKS
jgi:hypothetical protein